MIKSKLAAAVVAALAFGVAATATAHAQDAQAAPDTQNQNAQQDQNAGQSADSKNAKKLEAVTVTGSLIPQTQIETATPIVTITAADLKARGFATVAEALQQSSFATGSVQGAQDTNSFTPGAQTLSMFGLSVGFTKYLINGLPMGNFPGLYNGSDTFNSISGIPVDMVDHIDILPGGQSSLYGSDAIAGVINIVLKKHIDAPTVDARYGWYSAGGGASRRISLSDGFSVGRFTSLIGAQFESVQPIWAHDRSWTKQYSNRLGAPRASLDYVVASGTHSEYYYFDPNNCANVSSQWSGTEAKQTRAGVGSYCGSLMTPGAGTLNSGSKTANIYTHNTFDLSDNVQFYGDLLYNYSEQKYTNGSSTMFWNNLPYSGYYYDPRLDDLLVVQHSFAPEEVGGFSHIMDKQYEKSYMLSFGMRGTFGASNWDYDLSFTHSDDHVLSHNFQRFAQPLENYFSTHVMGAQMGTYFGYPVFEPTYENLYNPVSASDFRAMTGYTDDRAKTWDNLVRGQLTNSSLFSLPGGDAGLAVVLEAGNEGMDISPDPRFASGDIWGSSATPTAGHRSRYAATTELRLPLFSQLTLDGSARYDSYRVAGKDVSHGTYNVQLEYRPFDTLLLRGRYGTAFKVPTLSDEFQRPSGSYNYVMDYLNCNRQGHGGADFDKCVAPYESVQYQGETYGNPDLKPITAKVWSYGVVWAPIERMSFSVDYLHWDINNEVAQVSADQLSQTEYLCDIGTLDMNSATCQTAFALVTRGPGNGQYLGTITKIVTPKLNVANEQVNAITANFSWVKDIGAFGQLAFAASYSDELKHTYQDYPTDAPIDLLRKPGPPNYNTDFKSKANASLTWSKSKWSATAYVNRYGRSPNDQAITDDGYENPKDGKLGAWILWNASVTYNPTSRLGVSLLVNNVFNKMPPVDNTIGNSGQPYNTDNYNVYGRAIYLEANYKFGKGSNG